MHRKELGWSGHYRHANKNKSNFLTSKNLRLHLHMNFYTSEGNVLTDQRNIHMLSLARQTDHILRPTARLILVCDEMCS